MRVFVCNPPWETDAGLRGLRAGAAPPRVVDEDDPEVPWPAELASATALLCDHGLAATLVDSLATGESTRGFLERLDQLSPDAVAFASSAASFAADLDLLAEVAVRSRVALLWPGAADEVAWLVDDGLVEAVIAGEPERGLLAWCVTGRAGVYAPDPIERLDDLPRAWRDHTIHRYHLPLPGLPPAPQLVLELGRGGRWRSPGSVADEIDFCRRNWPRLGALATLGGEPPAELRQVLVASGLPWAARGAACNAADEPRVAPRRPVPRVRHELLIVGQMNPVFMGQGLLRAARAAGHRARGVDVAADPAQILTLLEAPAESIAIIDRGAGLPPELLDRVRCRTLLYSPEVLPTLEGSSAHAETRYAEFAPLARRVDDVVLHDEHPRAYLEWMGQRNIRGVVPLPVDPRRFRPLGVERDIDLLFVGSASEHRLAWTRQLAAAGLEVTWPNVWGEAFVAMLNRARVVLNLHFTPQPNTELRISEALACGCFVVSESLTRPGPFIAGEHVIEVTRETAADMIDHCLHHPAEREAIAAAGRAEVLAHHTAEQVLARLLALVGSPCRPAGEVPA